MTYSSNDCAPNLLSEDRITNLNYRHTLHVREPISSKVYRLRLEQESSSRSVEVIDGRSCDDTDGAGLSVVGTPFASNTYHPGKGSSNVRHPSQSLRITRCKPIRFGAPHMVW